MGLKQFIRNTWYIMAELDFSQLMSMAKSPETNKTLSTIDSIMKQMDNIEKIIKNVDSFIQVIEKSPSLSAAVRIAAKQNDVSLSPLRPDLPPVQPVVPVKEIVQVGVKPASVTHEAMYAELQNIPEDQLKEMIKQLQSK